MCTGSPHFKYLPMIQERDIRVNDLLHAVNDNSGDTSLLLVALQPSRLPGL